MIERNIISVIDGAAGSCGKGKVIGELATDKEINITASITNCMPNAGHTFVDEKGNKIIYRNIPIASINPNVELFIGPGSAIDMETFKEEYQRIEKYLKDRKIYVHERVPLIDERHKIYEKEHIKTGSTFKGCGAVVQEKIIRYPLLDFFKSYKNAVVVSEQIWQELLEKHFNEKGYILLEGAQGCDLCLNHSGNYPYVTSRNVSTAQMLADSGISAERLLETIMVIRPFPIRISNVTQDGKVIYTGAYGSGAPLWSQINIASLFGRYPFLKDLECYNYQIDSNRIKKLLSQCSEVALKQVFGANYRQKKISDITLIEALEIERLAYKNKGKKEYQSKIIDLPMFDSDYPPNTIIDQSELTSVTKMERRIFDLDIEKLKNNCRINTPYGLYLNFYQHLDYELYEKSGNFKDFYFNQYLEEYFNFLESETNTPILALGTGAKNGERILKRELIRK